MFKKIDENSTLGRFVRATRDIKCGEVILKERPYIVGPKVISTPICLGCHKSLEPQQFQIPIDDNKRKTKTVKNFYKCSKCKWPLCSEQCEKSESHIDECNLMIERKYHSCIEYNAEEEHRKESAYCVIVPLRCLLKSKIDVKKYKLVNFF